MPLIIKIVLLFVFGGSCFAIGLGIGFDTGWDKCNNFLLRMYDPEAWVFEQEMEELRGFKIKRVK